MLPYGVPFDSLSFLYFTSGHFFDLKILLGLSRFLGPRFFIPRCGSYVMLPYGVPFDSLSFLYLTSGHFFDLKILLGLSRFLGPRFFITRGWPSLVAPKGYHFDLFQTYISLAIFFLSSKSYWVYRVFWPLQFFILTDDGMDGVDGMVGPLFFWPISWKLLHNFS